MRKPTLVFRSRTALGDFDCKDEVGDCEDGVKDYETHPCVPFQDGTWSTSMLGCEEDDAEEGGPSVEVRFDIKKSL